MILEIIPTLTFEFWYLNLPTVTHLQQPLRVPTPIFSNKLRTQALLVCSMHFLFESDATRAQPAHGTCVVVALAPAPPASHLSVK